MKKSKLRIKIEGYKEMFKVIFLFLLTINSLPSYSAICFNQKCREKVAQRHDQQLQRLNKDSRQTGVCYRYIGGFKNYRELNKRHPIISHISEFYSYDCPDSQVSSQVLVYRKHQRELELARAKAPIIVSPASNYTDPATGLILYNQLQHQNYNLFMQMYPNAFPRNNPFYGWR